MKVNYLPSLPKALAIASGLALIIALVLLTLKRIQPLIFWSIAIAAALVAYVVLPKLKRR